MQFQRHHWKCKFRFENSQKSDIKMKSVIYVWSQSQSRLKKYNVQGSKSDTALSLPVISTEL